MFGGGGSIQLARVFGIRIGASPSWFVVLFVSILLMNDRYNDVFSQNQAYVLAVAAAVLFFGSLLLHELGHAFAARREGITITGIDLWFFGGIAKMARDTRSPGEEFRVAAAGPLVTALIVLIAAGAASLVANGADVWKALLLDVRSDSPAFALATWLAGINLFLLAFNLVPAFPLDGGRIARAVAWRLTGNRTRSTVISARLGQGFGYLLIGFGVFELLRHAGDGDASGLWSIVLGWFLAQAAGSAVVASAFQERLQGVVVGDLMDRESCCARTSMPPWRAGSRH
jgi:Zn-dependent protease